MTKDAARAAARARRRAAHATRGGGEDGPLRALLAAYRGRPLAGYWPIRSEIDPLGALAEAGAHGPVALPVIAGAARPLTFRAWSPEAEMTEGPYGARIPAHGAEITPEILIVPLLAFTRQGARLGYGGGYYDRTLARLRAAGTPLAIGYAYAAQEAETLPTEATDQRLDLVVTERETIAC